MANTISLSANPTGGGQLTMTSSNHPQYPPYREPSYELAVQTGINIAKLVKEILTACPGSPPPHLLKQAEELESFRGPTERLVGFMGDSGSGKSTSINSLMDQDGLAKTEACGSAVTPFAAEYAFRQTEHQAPFIIQCDFMDDTELGTYIANLLVDFRRYAFATKEELKHGGRDLENDYEAAKNVFEAAFGPDDEFDIDQLQYEDDEAGREQALDYLQGFIEELAFPENMEDSKWRHESKDAEDCQEQQSLLIERGLWPFVKSLRISADIGILSRGLTLIDLPGSKDTNIARVRIARKAMARCDDLCIVVRIDRVVDDPTVSQAMQELKDRADVNGASGFNATIICTRCADVANSKPLQKMANATEVKSAQAELKRIEDEAENTNMSIKQYNKAKRRAQLKLDSILVRARNKKVTEGLKRKYASLVGTGELKVFFIDNRTYTEDASEEGAELSGVHELRRYLEDLPAEALFKNKDIFLAKQIPAMLGSFEIWVESCKVNPERENRPRLPEVDDLIATEAALTEWRDAMLEAFTQCIDDPLEAASAHISLACLNKAKKWKDWHWCTKRAFARKLGTHETAKQGKHCWNTELLECFREVTAERWHELAANIQPMLVNLDKTILEPWTTYREQCCELGAPANFLNSLTSRHDILEVEIPRAKALYIREMEKLMANANTVGAGSHIVDCMLETYGEVGRDTGKGVTIRQGETLMDRVSSDEFVHDYRSKLYEQFQQTIEKVEEKIGTVLRTACETAENDLAAIQGRKGEIAMFKTCPEYGEKVEEAARKVQKQVAEMNDLAANARAMARQQYGYEST